MMSLQATRQMARARLHASSTSRRVAVKNRRGGVANPFAHIRSEVSVDDVLESEVIAWPIKRLESCPRSDGACAMVLADCRARANTAAVTGLAPCGMAESTDSMFIGDRLGDGDRRLHRRGDTPAGRRRGPTQQAGIGNRALRDLDLAEIYAPFTCNELKAYEALGFCERGQADSLVEAGTCEPRRRSCPSTRQEGPMCSNPIGATGLVRIAECVEQIRGSGRRAARSKRDARSQRAPAASSQFYTVCVLGDTRP